jgi:hypothetical protein
LNGWTQSNKGSAMVKTSMAGISTVRGKGNRISLPQLLGLPPRRTFGGVFLCLAFCSVYICSD